jgi:amino acid adenylation domain-containing protein
MKFLAKTLQPDESAESVALVEGSREVTYREFWAAVAGFREELTQLGAAPGKVIAIVLPKSIEAITAIYASLATGAAYVPIDPELPLKRLEYVLDQANPLVVVALEADSERFSAPFESRSLQTLWLGSPPPEDGYAHVRKSATSHPWPIGEPIESPSLNSGSGEDLAYMIFTSGSTGRPKGVMIPRRAMDAFLLEVVDAIPFYSPTTRALNLSPLYFDASMVEVFPTLMNRGRLILMDGMLLPNQLLQRIQTQKITFACVTSTVLKLIVSRFAKMDAYDLGSLELIWYGTESCPTQTVKEVQGVLPHVQLVQGYGPTEVTCTSHVYFVQPEDLEGEHRKVLPIGKPLKTIQCQASDKSGRPIQPGETGELYLGGDQVMLGYVGEPEKTQEALCSGAMAGGSDHGLSYRTRDFVTVDEAGNYTVLGRKDDMVKLAGKLVHLSEIEAVALAEEHVQDAVAFVDDRDQLLPRIILVLSVDEGANFEVANVQLRLVESLPSYMHPGEIVLVSPDQIPVLSTGKTDRRELKEGVMERMNHGQ